MHWNRLHVVAYITTSCVFVLLAYYKHLIRFLWCASACICLTLLTTNCVAQMTERSNGIGTTESAGDTRESPDCQGTNDQRFDALLHCQPGQQPKLLQHIQEHLTQRNKAIAKDNQGRDQRFVHKGELDPTKPEDDDGYISDDDCVAILFDMTSGPEKKDRKYQVFYGNVVKLTRNKSGRQVPGPRVHINNGGKAACKWFDEKLDKQSKPVTHNGKRAFHLTLDNPASFTDEVDFANVLIGVRMTLDKDNDCWLLNTTDSEYAETQMQRFSK